MLDYYLVIIIYVKCYIKAQSETIELRSKLKPKI